MSPDSTPTLTKLIYESNRFTALDLVKLLRIGHRALRKREADPSLFTLGELALLAKHLGRPTSELVGLALADMEKSPELAQRLEAGAEQVAGRKYAARIPAVGAKSAGHD